MTVGQFFYGMDFDLRCVNFGLIFDLIYYYVCCSPDHPLEMPLSDPMGSD